MRSPLVLLLLAACDLLSPAPSSELKELAAADAPCTTPDDCCAVFDLCHQQAFVVGREDYPRARDLAAEAAEDGPCTRCGPPPSLVLTCSEGRCLGIPVDGAGGAGSVEDHCGGPPLGEWGIPGARTFTCADAVR